MLAGKDEDEIYWDSTFKLNQERSVTQLSSIRDKYNRYTPIAIGVTSNENSNAISFFLNKDLGRQTLSSQNLEVYIDGLCGFYKGFALSALTNNGSKGLNNEIKAHFLRQTRPMGQYLSLLEIYLKEKGKVVTNTEKIQHSIAVKSTWSEAKEMIDANFPIIGETQVFGLPLKENLTSVMMRANYSKIVNSTTTSFEQFKTIRSEMAFVYKKKEGILYCSCKWFYEKGCCCHEKYVLYSKYDKELPTNMNYATLSHGKRKANGQMTSWSNRD
uniref:DDE_Tnp_ISL3 domain-containing protein n=1 Tax=Rhabditophanes sp. KR3021 TaxID=114890 RepID=A0AC35U0G3_9BILA